MNKHQPTNCLWCKHSQIRHGSLHCGIDESNLETLSKPLGDVANRCPYYELDPAKYALRKVWRKVK
ncbi:MAG: hypothetical protein U9M97_04875 [Candidatus Hadarchaeota archaeon]|nr:hypothetical protein [Candidatus Hadarchaeota archaeon]